MDMAYVIDDHSENSREKVGNITYISDKNSLDIRPDESASDEFKEPIVKTFKDLKIESSTKPDQNVGQTGATPGEGGEATSQSKCSLSSIVVTGLSQTRSEEQLSRSKVGTSASCPGPETMGARAPMRFRSRFRIPKLHIPITTFRRFRRSSSTHGQLVEEFASPNNTLERNQEPTTVAELPVITSGSDSRRRRRFDRLRNAWKGTKRSITSCGCLRRRDRSEDYRVSEEKNAPGLNSGRLELPPEFTTVSNENAEVETRTDHG